MSTVNTRNVVLNILLKVLYEDRFSHVVISDELSKYPELLTRDKRFIEHLSRGVIERKETLTAVIDSFSKTKVRKMKPVIACLLMMGTYELLFMESGDYAAVNEAVKLAGKRGFQGLRGFVNGVLRKISENGKFVYESLPEEKKTGMPEALFQTMVSWYGNGRVLEMGKAFLQKEHAGVSLRRNRSRISHEDFIKLFLGTETVLTRSPFSEDIYYAENLGDVKNAPGFNEGCFYIQDISSALSGDVVADLLERPVKILDTCGAPGGKSIHLADLSFGKAEIVTCDLSESKVLKIRENIERAGFPNMRAERRDASVFEPSYKDRFDLVVCDAPCSGLGIMGTKPDIRYHVTEESLRSIEEVQRNILNNVKNYVAPGGTLLYSTCTINPGENIAQVKRFLSENPEFEAVDLKAYLPESLRKFCEPALGSLQLVTGQEYPGTGFYVCRMKRKEK